MTQSPSPSGRAVTWLLQWFKGQGAALYRALTLLVLKLQWVRRGTPAQGDKAWLRAHRSLRTGRCTLPLPVGGVKGVLVW